VIRHIVLFTLRPGHIVTDPVVRAAARLNERMGDEVAELLDWRFRPALSCRRTSCDFVAIGLLRDESALERYLHDPFHVAVSRKWREISEWVVADLLEQDGATDDHSDGNIHADR
jgi:hypothetical protein